ncbi:MAG TPA: serine hydrolase domain-containing protein, partial [Pyrinomonadaceae bacterium]|nr:serine hydrolase domain-containing protein [Pyrinomonadaceae bacterium]
LAVIRDGRVIKEKAYGWANLELKIPATTDTVFLLASVTKIFTATAIMALVEDGKLSPEDKIRKLLPRLPLKWSGVTVRHLLTHTSGLPDVSLGQDTDAVISDTREGALKKLPGMPMPSRPGAQWSYNQTNYMLLAMIVEKVSGKSFEEFLAERFFRPLGMTSTSFGDSREIVPNRASGYTRFRRQTDENVSPDRVWNYHNVMPSYLNNAGGLNTTVGDMAKWDLALTEGRILKPSTLNQMWTAVKLSNGKTFRLEESLGYGYGYLVDDTPHHKAVGHSGGAATAYIRYLEDKISIVVLTNCQGSEPEDIIFNVAALYVSALAPGVKK